MTEHQPSDMPTCPCMSMHVHVCAYVSMHVHACAFMCMRVHACTHSLASPAVSLHVAGCSAVGMVEAEPLCVHKKISGCIRKMLVMN